MKKMLVVAEYVETEEIRSAVHALGIDYVQGYLIGLPAELGYVAQHASLLRRSA